MVDEELIQKNKELVEKYPFLLPRNRWTGKADDDYDYSYTELDEMPEGWRKAFGEQMCAEITEALRKANYLNEYRILQIKEKWGFLHWYDAGAPDEVYQIINRYENLSARTCIRCGKPATKLSMGWICPWCDDCAAEMDGHDSFESIKEGDLDDLS